MSSSSEPTTPEEKQKKAETPKWIKILAIPLTLAFGVSVTIVSKLTYQEKADGRENYGNHPFEKPLLQTAAMNVGMLFALVIYFFQWFFAKEKPLTPSVKGILFIFIPAFLDTFATTLQSIALLYLQPSVWQMFRGSLVFFSWILSITVLKRRNYLFMTLSIIIILIGLTIVGISVVAQTGFGTEGSKMNQIFVAIILVISAQLVQAIQIVVEDHLLHNVQATAVFIVGFKGLWGTILSCAIMLPVAQYFPSDEGNGLHEDTIDSFIMMSNNWIITLLIVLYIILIFGFNLYGMYVTDVTDAVVRTIIEGIRALAVWIVGIIIYYSISLFAHKDPTFGEKLTPLSFLEFIGFVLLFFGTLFYKEIIKFPFFKYPHDETTVSQEQLLHGDEYADN